MNAKKLIEKLMQTQGPLSVNEGVLWFENGEAVNLSEVAAATDDSLQSLQLKEAMSILAGLGSFGYLTRSGMEENERLPMLKMRARNLTKFLGITELDDLKDGEVLGLDADGHVMTWNAAIDFVGGCTLTLEEYGVHKLKAHEIVRVGITYDQWVRACQEKNGPARSRTVFVGAFVTAEFGEGPSFAKFTVTPSFIEQLQRLTMLCKEHQLSEVRVTGGPDLWGGCDEDALRLQCQELVVSVGSFWFTDAPKHMDYDIQSRAQSTESFIELVTSEGDEVIFIDGIEEEVALATSGGELDDDDDLDDAQQAGASLPTGLQDTQHAAPN